MPSPPGSTRRAFLVRGAGSAALVSLPLVRWRPRRLSKPAQVAKIIDSAGRAKVLDALARAIAGSGFAVHDVLAGAHLAATRSMVPSRYLGGEFHALLTSHPMSLASDLAQPRDRWHAALQCVDYYKFVLENHYEPGASFPEPGVKKSTDAEAARAAFLAAAAAWDRDAVDAALVMLHRVASRDDAFDALFHLAARDMRYIGHKTIAVANTWRMSAAIPWDEFLACLRSAARTLVLHEQGNPKDRDSDFDRAWRENGGKLGALGDAWQKGDQDRTVWFLDRLRRAGSADITGAVLGAFGDGASLESFWTAVACSSAEMLFAWPRDVVALHAVTTSNALRTCFDAARSDATRRVLVLQTAARVVAFWEYMRKRKGERQRPTRIGSIRAAATEHGWRELLAAPGEPPEKLDALAGIADRKPRARLWREYLATIRGAATDVHDYKHGMAVFEDARRLPAAWSARYVAMSTFALRLPGAEPLSLPRVNPHSMRDSQAVDERIERALSIVR